VTGDSAGGRPRLGRVAAARAPKPARARASMPAVAFLAAPLAAFFLLVFSVGLAGGGCATGHAGADDHDDDGTGAHGKTSRKAESKAESKTAAPGVGQPAPEIVVDRLSGGHSLSLSSLRGKVVLLDVWASWCGPCKQELPMLDAIAGRLRGRGVEVLAVSIDQQRENVEKFLGARAHWNLTVAHDPNGDIADTFQPDKMPTSYAIDRAGVIRYVNSGFVPADAPEIERRLADLAKDGAGGGADGDTGSSRPQRRRP